MSITSVRAKLNNVWYPMTYNNGTLYWDCSLSASKTSYNQPGGYFPIDLEVTLDTGEVQILSSIDLRVIVKETVAPSITLASPPEGFVVVNNPSIVFNVIDESGGSGVNVNSIQTTCDGVLIQHTAVATSSGYTVTVNAQNLAEGNHTFVIQVSDFDGNSATKSATYTVDTIHPVITLVSPSTGYLTNPQPTVIFNMTDVSGLNLDTAVVTLDGVTQTTGITASANQLTFTPSSALSEGNHSISFSIKDNAGNISSISVSYIVDITPPTLVLDASDYRVVVDDYTLLVQGHVEDLLASPVSVTVADVATTVDANGNFETTTDLQVGENFVHVVATDSAGLTTESYIYKIRMRTDRTQEDVDALRELQHTRRSLWSEDIKQRFIQAQERGGFNYTDANRIEIACNWLNNWYNERGCNLHIRGRYDWTRQDIPWREDMDVLLNDVLNTSTIIEFDIPMPSSLKLLNYQMSNNIEKMLVQLDKFRKMWEESLWYSSEIYCGEY